MYVIGISSGIKHGHHDGAAVLLRDGELIAAAEEERFTLIETCSGGTSAGRHRLLPEAGEHYHSGRGLDLFAAENLRQLCRTLDRIFQIPIRPQPENRTLRSPPLSRREQLLRIGVSGGDGHLLRFFRRFKFRGRRTRQGRCFSRIDALWQAQQPRALLRHPHAVSRLSNDQRRIQGHGPVVVRKSALPGSIRRLFESGRNEL